MTIAIAITRSAANTATGTQDFTTTDLGGQTPKAALFIVTRATSNGVAAADAAIAIGAATGAAQRWSMFSFSNDAQAATDDARIGMTDRCIVIPTSGGAIDAEADFDSFISNGVRINWTDAPASAYLVTVILFAGSELSAYAGTFAPGTTVDAAIDVTAPGFQPDVVLLATPGTAFNDSSVVDHLPSFGFVVRDGSDTQRSIHHSEDSGVADGAPNAFFSASYGIGQISVGTSNLAWACQIGGFDGSGFSATLRIGSASTDEVGYLAISLGGGASFWAGTHSTPTATGNQSSTAPGFQPQFVLMGLTQQDTVNAGSGDASAGPIGIGAFTATAAFSNTMAIEDAAATTNTQSLSTAQVAELADDDGTAGINATFVSMNSTGWTLNFSATKGTARQWAALAVSVASPLRPWWYLAQQ